MRKCPDEIQRRRFLKTVCSSALGCVMLSVRRNHAERITALFSDDDLVRAFKRYGGEFGGVLPGKER